MRPTPEGVRVADGYVIVLTTIGLDVDPAVLGTRLVDERLAACVNVLPEMDSFFRWRGAVERDQERQVIIKTTTERLPTWSAVFTNCTRMSCPSSSCSRCSRGARRTCGG